VFGEELKSGDTRCAKLLLVKMAFMWWVVGGHEASDVWRDDEAIARIDRSHFAIMRG